MKNLLIILSTALLLLGCRKDSEEVSTQTSTSGFEPTAVYVNGTVYGQVLNASGQIMTDVEVHIGDNSTYTNQDGYFIFRDVPLNSRGAYIHTAMPGHWHASRKVVPHHNKTHFINLVLAPITYNSSLNAGEGGTVELPGGPAIEFPSNSFSKTDGTSYTGIVSFALRWMDPLDTETGLMMPGAFHGIDSDKQEVALKNYGIAGVEMMAENGEPLNIAEGQMATLRLPIPQALQSEAPANLKLWHFDEAAGYWRQEATATREGDAYIAEVSHFSFWSANEDFETVMLEGTLVNQQGAPLSNASVTIQFPSQGLIATGFTNADGAFSGLVPSGEELVLMVSDDCNFSVYAQNVGPLADDTDLGAITIGDTEISTTTVTGSLVNCNGDAISLGIINICWPQGCQSILPDLDGNFSRTFTYCGTQEFDISVVDYNTGETFSSVEPAQGELNLGTIEVCEGPLENFISLDFNGTERFYPFPNQYIQGNNIFLRAEDSMYSFKLSIPQAAVGTYTDSLVSFNYFDYSTNPDIPLFLISGSCSFGECDNLQINITDYGPVGGFIEGNYIGTVDFTTTTQNFPNAPISGSFRVIRSF